MTRTRRLIALALPLVVGVTLLSPAAAAPNNVCTTPPPLEPVVREVTVNQGVGEYETLAWNKRTVVRAYLTKPMCHDTNTVELLSAVLGYRVVRADGTTSTGEVQATAPVTGLTLGDYGDGIVGGTAAHDPTFVIDGTELPRALATDALASDPSAPFKLELQLRIGYRGIAGTTVTEGTKSHDVPARTFGRKQNALRVILVPLVAGTDALDPVDAVNDLQEEVVGDLYSLSRITPIASGLKAGIEPGGPGVRYSWHPAYDITPYLDGSESGKFCGGDGDPVAGSLPVMNALTNIRLAYNLENGTTIDRVVGIVASQLTPANTGCTQGRANREGAVAWARADGPKGHNRAGSLISHELSHTMRVDHTDNTTAEDKDRAFDTLTGARIEQDRTVMNYRSTEDWNDGATLLQPHEWERTLCRLTPGFPIPELCTNAVSSTAGDVGTDLAKDGERFAMAGYTDGTAAGTRVSSHEVPLGASTDVDDNSEYKLVQRSGTGVALDVVGVPVAASENLVDEASVTGERLHFAVTVPVAEDTAAYELWRGTPDASGSVLLHRRLRNGAPTILDAQVVPAGGEPRNVTNDALDEDAPALSADGSLLAFTIDGSIYVQPVDDAAARSVPLLGEQPAWSTDGQLAYIRDGDVRVVDVRVEAGTPVFGADGVLYASTNPFSGPFPASSPTWEPDGDEIGVIIADEIRALTTNPAVAHTSTCAALTGCRVLRPSSGAQSIAWSEDGVMAFDDGTHIRAFDVDVAGVAENHLLIEQSVHPRWGGSSLVSDSGGGVLLSTIGRNAFGQPTVTSSLTLATGTLATPTLAGDGTRAAWIENAYRGSSEFPSDDVMVVDTDRRRLIVEATDDDLSTLEGTVLLACGGDEPLVHPLLVALQPVVTGGGAQFTVDIDDRLLCDGGELSFELNDGVQLDRATVGGAGSEAAPTVGIHEPGSDGDLSRFSSITLAGAGFDRDGNAVDLEWYLTTPDGTESLLSTDPFPTPVPAPDGGWTPGAYTVVLRGTDASGATSETTSTFDIVEDADGDGIPAHLETGSCLGSDPDHDPSTPHGDPDGDGVPTAMDDDPCTSSVDVVADFEPDTLYVPSTGPTVAVRLPIGDLPQGNVSITRIGGHTVDVPALSLSTERGGIVVAKFDRQWLNGFLAEHQLVGTYVPIVVRGARADGSSFGALDPHSPITSPG